MKSTAEIGADIVKTLPECVAPPELLERMKVWQEANDTQVRLLRTLLLTVAMDWIEEAEKHAGDREVIERVLAGELQFAAAVVIRAMKLRMGQDFSPARFAVVAYEIADAIKDAANEIRQEEAA